MQRPETLGWKICIFIKTKMLYLYCNILTPKSLAFLSYDKKSIQFLQCVVLVLHV